MSYTHCGAGSCVRSSRWLRCGCVAGTPQHGTLQWAGRHLVRCIAIWCALSGAYRHVIYSCRVLSAVTSYTPSYACSHLGHSSAWYVAVVRCTLHLVMRSCVCPYVWHMAVPPIYGLCVIYTLRSPGTVAQAGACRECVAMSGRHSERHAVISRHYGSDRCMQARASGGRRFSSNRVHRSGSAGVPGRHDGAYGVR